MSEVNDGITIDFQIDDDRGPAQLGTSRGARIRIRHLSKMGDVSGKSKMRRL
jgi:hypothetical protein